MSDESSNKRPPTQKVAEPIGRRSSPELEAALKRLGLDRPSVKPATPSMPTLSLPVIPSFVRAIPPAPDVDWDWLDSLENSLDDEPADETDSIQVAKSIFAQRKPGESTAERNARWLSVFDVAKSQTSRGAQARAMKDIAQVEDVNEATVKRGIQDARKARDEAASNKAKPKATPAKKHTAANPFDDLTRKAKTSP